MGILGLNVEQQFRRDTAASWKAKNPILSEGEPGLELDTGKIKIGDGAKGWNSLPYFASDKAQVDLSNVSNSTFLNKANSSGWSGYVVSETAPTNTKMIWIQTSTGIVKYHNGSAWVNTVGVYA